MRRRVQAPALRINFAPLLAMAFGFFAFLPYPALAVGNASAIQIGNVITMLACAPGLLMSWRRRPFWIFAAILAPLVLSSIKVAVSGGDDLDLCVKGVIMWALACLTIVATQIQGPRFALELLTGAAIATLLHTAVGFYQFYSFFSQSVFPLVDLYVNPSFLSVQDNARTIARYTRRPFGIFPEPSAMAASLAPWLLFWASELLGLVKLRRTPARWQRWLFGAAAVGGVALIIISQSGHAVVTLAMAMLLAGVWLTRCKATPRTFLTLAILFGAILPAALYFGVENVGTRFAGKSAVGNSSWEERWQSLVVGFNLLMNGDGATVLFGLGTGISSPMVYEASGIQATFSILLTYLYETGIVGALCMLGIGAFIGRVWRSVRFDLTFAAMLIVWLVGVTLTTSYHQLLPIWMTLGWLTIWPTVCVPITRSSQAEASAAAARERRARQTGMPIITVMPIMPLSRDRAPVTGPAVTRSTSPYGGEER
jgi:hypothetical protein